MFSIQEWFKKTDAFDFMSAYNIIISIYDVVKSCCRCRCCKLCLGK